MPVIHIRSGVEDFKVEVTDAEIAQLQLLAHVLDVTIQELLDLVLTRYLEAEGSCPVH